jgi:hypothetical protein
MSRNEHQQDLSRRTLLTGLAATASAAGLSTVLNMPTAQADTPEVSSTQAFGGSTPGLVYLPIDAFAFDVAGTSTNRRIYQETTGVQPLTPANFIFASLPIPVGAVIKQINVGYQGQPILYVARRSISGTPGTSTLADIVGPITLAAGGGAKTQSIAVTAELTSGGIYSMKVFCSAGDSILGMSVGYIPAPQAFIPYTGPQPRALDTRSGTKFAVGEDRVIDLSSFLIPTARAAVINLTATDTAGSGYLGAYADGIAWPGNSTLNYATNQSIANTTVVPMTAGKIKVRCGDAATHVIVDVIGSLL